MVESKPGKPNKEKFSLKSLSVLPSRPGKLRFVDGRVLEGLSCGSGPEPSPC